MSRLPTGKIRIRFKRAYRGYRKGDVIAPTAGAAQMLLQAKSPLGEKVAEVVEDAVVDAAPQAEAPAAEVSTKKRGRPPKGKK